MYRKETIVRTRSGIYGPGREGEGGRQKEAIGMVGGSGLGRSTNHRTVRPTSPQRSRHLALQQSVLRIGRKREEKGRGRRRRDKDVAREAEHRWREKERDAQHHHRRWTRQWPGDSVSPPRAVWTGRKGPIVQRNRRARTTNDAVARCGSAGAVELEALLNARYRINNVTARTIYRDRKAPSSRTSRRNATYPTYAIYIRSIPPE